MTSPDSDSRQPVFHPLTALLVTLLMMTIAGLAPGLLALLFFGPDAGSFVAILIALLVGGWFPLKSFLSGKITPELMLFGALPLRFVPVILPMAAIGFMLAVPLLWIRTFPAFLAGALIYGLTAESIAGFFAGLVGLFLLVLRQIRYQATHETQQTLFVSQFSNIMDMTDQPVTVRSWSTTTMSDHDQDAQTAYYHLAAGDTDDTDDEDHSPHNDTDDTRQATSTDHIVINPSSSSASTASEETTQP